MGEGGGGTRVCHSAKGVLVRVSGRLPVWVSVCDSVVYIYINMYMYIFICIVCVWAAAAT